MKPLLKVIGKTTWSETLQVDFFLGLLAAGGAVTLAIMAPERLLATTGVAATVFGVVMGAVIAGVAVQAAFLDQSFLKKLRTLNKPPVDYLAPFLFTVFIGVWALIGLVVMSAFSSNTWTAVVAVVGGLTAFLSAWSLVSILPAMSTLVQFIELRDAAVDVPEQPDIDHQGRRAATPQA